MTRPRLPHLLRLAGVALALLSCGVTFESKELSEPEKNHLRFAWQCYTATPTHPVLVSPLGLNLNLAVLDRGSAGETRRQFQALLPSRGGDALAEMRRLRRELPAQKDELSIENTFRYDDSVTRFKADFLADLERDDYCVVEKTTYPKNSEAWKIFELRTVVIFESAWATPFEPENVDASFYRAPGQPGEAMPMMVKDDVWLAGYEDESWQSVWLPFRNNDFGMLVLKPQTIVPEPELAAKLNAEVIIRHLERATVDPYTLRIPKFNFRSELNGNQLLKSMNCPVSSLDVNFSNIYEHSNLAALLSAQTRYTDLVVVGITQSNHFEINEVRAKGESVTVSHGIALGCSAEPQFKLPNKIFTANRPFIYLLIHRPSKAVIFIGSYNYLEKK